MGCEAWYSKERDDVICVCNNKELSKDEIARNRKDGLCDNCLTIQDAFKDFVSDGAHTGTYL